MSEYKRYIDELKLDEQFKDDLLEKMREKQSDLQNIAEPAGFPAPVHRSRRKFFGVLSAAACAVLACLVIVPVVVLTGPAASHMDGVNSDFLWLRRRVETAARRMTLRRRLCLLSGSGLRISMATILNFLPSAVLRR